MLRDLASVWFSDAGGSIGTLLLDPVTGETIHSSSSYWTSVEMKSGLTALVGLSYLNRNLTLM